MTWTDSSNREYIVICADYDDPTLKSHIQSFNTETSKWSDVAAYPKGAKPYRFTTSIDAKNGTLYIYGGQWPVFLKYKLDDNQFEVECLNGQYDEQQVAEQKNITATGWYPASVFMDDDTLHVFSGLGSKHHVAWDSKLNLMNKMFEFNIMGLFGHQTVYIQSMKKVLILGGIKGWGGHSQSILSLDVSTMDQAVEWTKFEVELPCGMAHFGCVVYNERVLTIFGGEKSGGTESDGIWCLDLHHVANGWVHSTVQCPVAGRFHAVITDKMG